MDKNEYLDIKNDKQYIAEALKDVTWPEDLHVTTMRSFIERKTDIRPWFIELALKVEDETDTFSNCFNNPHRDDLEHNFCLHFLWDVHDYATEVKKAMQRKNHFQVQFFLLQMMPFATADYETDYSLDDAKTRYLISTMFEILADYLGLGERSYTNEQLITRMRYMFGILRDSENENVTADYESMQES